MKDLYALLLTSVSLTSSGQNKTNLPKENINSENKDSITSRVPNSGVFEIEQDRKGNIWIATNDAVYRYDGSSFSNITNKVSSARFISVLKIEKETSGSLLLVPEFFIMMGNRFEILKPERGLPATEFFVCMKTERAIFGSAQQTEEAVTMGNPFGTLK